MHEFSIAENTLQIATDQMATRAATRIHSLTLRIGALSGVVPDALTFAWEALARGTPAEGARLLIEQVPVVCYCQSCQREFETEAGNYHCPACAELSTEIRRGREMDLMSMEVS